MSIQHFRLRPLPVEAINWDGIDSAELATFAAGRLEQVVVGRCAIVKTPNGAQVAFPGDWIVKVRGGFFPMKQEIFEQTYEAVE